jgi:hypothetical protein
MSLRASRILLLYELLKIITKARSNCESIIARFDIGIADDFTSSGGKSSLTG